MTSISDWLRQLHDVSLPWHSQRRGMRLDEEVRIIREKQAAKEECRRIRFHKGRRA